MSPKPVTALRQRLLEDMAVRHFGEKSKHDYLRHIDQFLAFLGRSPETATVDDLRDFQVHLNRNGVRPCSFNSAVSALRFFFCTTLGQPELGHQVMRLLEAAPGRGLKYKAALSVAYGAGLRALEVCTLRVSDIDSKRMLIRVELGKGGKDRFAMLSPQLLELLRAWWRQCRSKVWLFPDKDPLLPLTTRQLNRACHVAAEAAGLGSWSRRTLCATASLRVCWKCIRMFALSKCFWDMRNWKRPRGIRRSRPTGGVSDTRPLAPPTSAGMSSKQRSWNVSQKSSPA